MLTLFKYLKVCFLILKCDNNLFQCRCWLVFYVSSSFTFQLRLSSFSLSSSLSLVVWSSLWSWSSILSGSYHMISCVYIVPQSVGPNDKHTEEDLISFLVAQLENKTPHRQRDQHHHHHDRQWRFVNIIIVNITIVTIIIVTNEAIQHNIFGDFIWYIIVFVTTWMLLSFPATDSFHIYKTKTLRSRPVIGNPQINNIISRSLFMLRPSYSSSSSSSPMSPQ